MINIIRKGFVEIPKEAYLCPVCGKKEKSYSLHDLKYADPAMELCHAVINDHAQKFPTFICDKCQTIWQYIGEKEEEKK